MARYPFTKSNTRTLRVRFKTTGRGWEVDLDGVDLTANLSAITIVGAVGDITRVDLTLIGPALDIEGDVAALPKALSLAMKDGPLEVLGFEPALCPRCGHTVDLFKYVASDPLKGVCPACAARVQGGYEGEDFQTRLVET